jgi:hypothetical protein
MLRLAARSWLGRGAPRSLACAASLQWPCKREPVRFFSSNDAPYVATQRVVRDNERVWRETVNPALRCFLDLRGHTIVPNSFVVPRGDADWPQQAWGYPLGKHSQWLRSRWTNGLSLPSFTVKDLEAIDFAFDRSQYKWDHFIMPTLRRYFELHGNTDMLQSFRVPVGDPAWPERLWDFGIGSRVFNMRYRGDFKAQIEANAKELAELSFCYDSTTYNRDWDEKVLPALQVFRQEFGHCDVFRSFKVPDCAPWPKAAAGVALGVTVNNMRSNNYYADHVARDKPELDKLEFVWDHAATEWNTRLFPAVAVYARLAGDCRIPKDFEVPPTEPWPVKAHGLKLGVAVHNIRVLGYYFDHIARDVDRLASVGFHVLIPPAKWRQRVEPLLATFQRLHGHRAVPRDFVVPESLWWSESDRGIQLGKLKPKHRTHESVD